MSWFDDDHYYAKPSNCTVVERDTRYSSSYSCFGSTHETIAHIAEQMGISSGRALEKLLESSDLFNSTKSKLKTNFSPSDFT